METKKNFVINAAFYAILAALALGMICAVSGLKQTLMLMEKMHKQNHKDTPPVPGFNEHT